jgi:mannose-1-phosphate guanylyltransferase
MLARVPFIPRLDLEREPLPSHVWTVVLTGDGPPEPGRSGCAHGRRIAPRVPVAMDGPRRIERISRLVPAGQTIAVLTRANAAAWALELASAPQARAMVQPGNRGRAAELLLPLLKIARRDPAATLVVLPADQRLEDEARFPRGIARALWAVALRPELPILIAAHPDHPVRDGWIEPGAPLDGLEHLALHTVGAYVDGASLAQQRRLLDAGALVSTGVIVARAGTLRALAALTLPDVLETLEPLEDAFDRPEESLMIEAVYECMPHRSLSALVRARDVAVLALPDVAWQHITDRSALALAS